MAVLIHIAQLWLKPFVLLVMAGLTALVGLIRLVADTGIFQKLLHGSADGRNIDR